MGEYVEGFGVGLCEGDTVGWPVGLADAVLVGASVGVIVGVPVGLPGSSLGVAVGLVVGPTVGDSVRGPNFTVGVDVAVVGGLVGLTTPIGSTGWNRTGSAVGCTSESGTMTGSTGGKPTGLAEGWAIVLSTVTDGTPVGTSLAMYTSLAMVGSKVLGS